MTQTEDMAMETARCVACDGLGYVEGVATQRAVLLERLLRQAADRIACRETCPAFMDETGGKAECDCGTLDLIGEVADALRNVTYQQLVK